MLSVLKFISYNNQSKINNINRIDRINNNYIMNQNNFKDYANNKECNLDINKLPLNTNYLGINNYNLINYNYYLKKILLNSFSIGLILGVGSAYLIEDRIPINYLGFSKYVGYQNLSSNNINNSLNLVLLYLSNFSLVTIICGLFNFNIHQFNRFQNILYYSVISHYYYLLNPIDVSIIIAVYMMYIYLINKSINYYYESNYKINDLYFNNHLLELGTKTAGISLTSFLLANHLMGNDIYLVTYNLPFTLLYGLHNCIKVYI